MSIIVAAKKDNALVLAADSLVCFGDAERIDPVNARTAKISRLGDSIIGSTGWAVYDDVLRDYLHDRPTPQLHDEHDIFRFFMEFWKALHEKYSFVNDQSQSKESPFGDLDASFLIANRHGLFKVSSDMGITRFERYYAIGCASEYALGSLYALYDQNLTAEQLAKRAVETAISFDIRCAGPIDIAAVE